METSQIIDKELDKVPSFKDLVKNAEVGLTKRVITRYLFCKNPEKSIELHKKLGAPITRALVMNTFGKFLPRTSYSNYRTDPSKPKIESSTRFAVGGSVFNEAFHTAAGLQQGYELITELVANESIIRSSIAVGVNAALVSLQRYNRARMVQSVNQELENNQKYEPEYRNWLGLDSTSYENYVRLC